MKFNLQLKVTQTEGGSGPFLSRDLAICLHELNFTQNLIFACSKSSPVLHLSLNEIW